MRKLTLSLAVMAALMPVRGYPLGLGEIELNSALNQELNAEIEVMSATPEDAEQLIVKLASRDAFSRAGIDRPFLLQQLKFKVVEVNGQPVVKVFTKRPIREPYLNFLLEIDWPKGHLLREYTLLLDPPVYNTGVTSGPVSSESAHPFIDPTDAQAQPQSAFPEQSPAQQAQSGVAAPVTTAAANTATISSDSGRSMSYQYQPMPQATTTASPDQYRVQQNDTLWSIANRLRPDSSVSVEQMMLALVRKNPEAFIQENINGVKRGYILRTPSRDEATQITRQEAVAEAREHASLWREYSRAGVSQAPASSMEAEDQPSMAMDAQPSSDVEGKLSILGAGEGDGSEVSGSNQDPSSQLSRLKQELAMAQEQLESERLEKEDLQSRLSDLEQRVQRVIEMDDGELAQLQQDLQESKQAVEADSMADVVPEEVVDEAPAEDMMAEDMPAEDMPAEEAPAEDMLEEPVAEEGMAPEAMDSESQEMADDAVFVDETDAAVSDAEMPAQAVEPVQAVEPPAFAQQKPKSFIESLMEDPKLLGIIGGGLAFIILLITLLMRRLRGKQDEGVLDDELSGLEDLDGHETIEPPQDAMDATTEMMVEPSSDLGMEDTQIEAPDEESLEDTVFSLNDTQEIEAPADEEKDDVIAEADVYLAYGIYQQAEDLLNKAIDQNPERDDYRMKLLETHYAAKNEAGFEQLAQDVKARKGDDPSYWNRVVAMGMELVPTSSLFSGSGDLLADIDAEALLPEKPDKADLELDPGAVSDELADLGLGDDLGGLDEMDLGETGEMEAMPEGDALSDALDESLMLDEPLDLAESATEEAGDLDLADQLETISTELEEPVEESAAGDLGLDLGEDLAETGADDLDIDDDFSLDFEASDLGFEESEAAAGETADAGDDLDLGVDLDEASSVVEDDEMEMDLTGEFDLGLDADEPEAEEAAAEVEMDLGDDLDLGEGLDLDADLGTDTSDDVIDLDEGEIDLADDEIDLGGELSLDDSEIELDMSAPEADSGEASDDDSDFDISELSEDVDEVSTKLDLARAYIDMGDNEGARSILEEVKAEGNDEQQQQAEALLQQAS